MKRAKAGLDRYCRSSDKERVTAPLIESIAKAPPFISRPAPPSLDHPHSIGDAFYQETGRNPAPQRRFGRPITLPSAEDWNRDIVEKIALESKDEPGALMVILRRVQDALGWVPRGAVPVIADIVNLSRAEVHGVVSFYHDFRPEPPGRTVVRLCRAESCQAAGGEALADHVQNRLGLKFGQTTRDGSFTLEAVYCLGNCACSPAAVIGDELIGRLTPDRFDQIIASAERVRR